MSTVFTRRRERQGTAAAMVDEVLLQGEWGYETDTGRVRIGDGVTPWPDLEFIVGSPGPEGPAGPEGPEGPAGPAGPTGANIGEATLGVDVATPAQVDVIRGRGVSRFLSKMRAGLPVKICGLGDSSVEGLTVVTPGNDLLSRLKADLEDRFGIAVTVTNRAVSGYIVAHTLGAQSTNRFLAAVADDADLYIMANGGNEAAYAGSTIKPNTGYEMTAHQAGLEHMVRRLRIERPGADIVLANKWPYTDGSVASNTVLEPITAMQKTMAATYGCAFVDQYAHFKTLGVGTSSTIDEMYIWPNTHVWAQHLTDLGYEVWADLFALLFPHEGELPAVESPALPARPLWGAERYTHSLWQSTGVMAGGLRVSGTSGYALTGSWAGTSTLPQTSTTAGDTIAIYVLGSEAAVQLDTGTGQGVISLLVDGALINGALSLAGMSGGQRQVMISGLGPGMHRIVITTVSGSVTFRGVRYLTCQGSRTGGLSTLCGYSGTWIAPAADASYFDSLVKLTTELNATTTIPFVGTALSVNTYIYAATTCGIGITIDGGTETVVQWVNAVGTSGPGARLVCSGLTYGRHTVTLRLAQAARQLVISSWLPYDETRTDRPFTFARLGVTGESSTFGLVLPGVPTVQLTPDDATSTVPPYTSTLTSSAVVPSGTAAARFLLTVGTGRIAW